MSRARLRGEVVTIGSLSVNTPPGITICCLCVPRPRGRNPAISGGPVVVNRGVTSGYRTAFTRHSTTTYYVIRFPRDGVLRFPLCGMGWGLTSLMVEKGGEGGMRRESESGRGGGGGGGCDGDGDVDGRGG
jgi:hypothetical protein